MARSWQHLPCLRTFLIKVCFACGRSGVRTPPPPPPPISKSRKCLFWTPYIMHETFHGRFIEFRFSETKICKYFRTKSKHFSINLTRRGTENPSAPQLSASTGQLQCPSTVSEPLSDVFLDPGLQTASADALLFCT